MSADLVAFLRARLDEDKRAATAATGEYGAWHTEDDDGPMIDGDRLDVRAFPERGGDVLIAQVLSTHGNDAAHIARWDPTRVLAEVAAKRAILDLHSCMSEQDWHGGAVPGNTCRECGSDPYPCDTVRLLVQPHAGHPHFHPSWTTA